MGELNLNKRQHSVSPPLTGVRVVDPLPTLEVPRDGHFLQFTDEIAGRHVCIKLYAKNDTRVARRAAWELRKSQVNMVRLGAAAKALEDANINWRKLGGHEKILEAHAKLQTRMN